MPRSRRQWSDMRADIRELLRETVAADSYWSDGLLLTLFNQAMDRRSMELINQYEGWLTDCLDTDIVAGQREYTVPEGTDNVMRVLRVYNDGGDSTAVPLVRDERYTRPTRSKASTTTRGALPTYRVLGELVILEPTPTESETNGLQIEVQSMPTRLTADASKLDRRLPASLETVLIYDTAVLALDIEAAQGNIDPTQAATLVRPARELAAIFFDLTAVRSRGFVASAPYTLGD